MNAAIGGVLLRPFAGGTLHGASVAPLELASHRFVKKQPSAIDAGLNGNHLLPPLCGGKRGAHLCVCLVPTEKFCRTHKGVKVVQRKRPVVQLLL